MCLMETWVPGCTAVVSTDAFSCLASAPTMLVPRPAPAGAVAGMVSGMSFTLYYLLANAPWLRAWLRLAPESRLWWDIMPSAGGVFGVAAGVTATVLVSLVTRAGTRARGGDGGADLF